MVFFSAVFAARTPAMGNSADRAWQLSQLVEGVLTAFNPSRGSLSYVQAGHCVSKQIGLPTVRFSLARLGGPHKAGRLCGERRSSVVIELSCLHGSERYAACFDEVVARAVRVSQPAVLSVLLVIQLFGIVIPPPYFLLRAPKGALRPFSVAALLHYVLWCASEYSVVGRISCHDSYDSTRTNVCQ